MVSAVKPLIDFVEEITSIGLAIGIELHATYNFLVVAHILRPVPQTKWQSHLQQQPVCANNPFAIHETPLSPSPTIDKKNNHGILMITSNRISSTKNIAEACHTSLYTKPLAIPKIHTTVLLADFAATRVLLGLMKGCPSIF